MGVQAKKNKKKTERAISWVLNHYENLQKHFYVTTTNTLLMKLTMIMYLHKNKKGGIKVVTKN